MKNKEFWKTLINIIVTVLTALGTTLGISSCMYAYVGRNSVSSIGQNQSLTSLLN